MPAVIGSHGITPFTNPYFQFLLIFAAVGPALAAVIVTQVAYGKAHVEHLLKALIRWRAGLGWHLVAGLGPFALLLVAQGVTKFFGLSATYPTPQGDVFPLALAAFAISLFSNPWEEAGWRGFALPHLQKRYTALVATFIVGMLWGL
jgi:membrane protease YdiL (CAAX protease family)